MHSKSTKEGAKHVLGIDPGSAKLGLSYVKWNGKDCNDERNFSVEWMCLIHLTGSFKGRRDSLDNLAKISNSNENATEIVKYREMHDQFERLNTFLETNRNFNAILKIEGLRVCIEQQEGARDINVLFRLMRINFLSGTICAYLKRKKVPFTFVPKTYKCGWSFLGTLAKKKLEGVTKTRKRAISIERKKALLKQYKKEATCALVKRTVEIGDSTSDIKRFSIATKNSDFNHLADSASQAMRYVKELALSGCYDNELRMGKKNSPLPLKKVKDGVSVKMKEHLNAIF